MGAVYSQSLAASTWNINHNLDTQYPLVTIYDSSNAVVLPQSIVGTDANNITITFPPAQTGYANLSKAGSYISGSVLYQNITNAPFQSTGSVVSMSGSLIITGSLTVSGSGTFNNVGPANFTGSTNMSGSLSVSGSITTNSTITAQTLVVQTVSSSVIYSSGSNVFGNNIANTQVMTGSVTITGSLAVVTTGTEFQVTNTGVKIGNVSTDVHSITGSVNVSGSATFTSTVTTDGKITANGGGLLLDLNGGSDTFSRVTGNRGNGDNLHVSNIEFYNSFSSRLVGEVRGITGAGGTQSNSGQLAFYTNDNGTYAERMKIYSEGQIGIKGAATTEAAYALFTNDANTGFFNIFAGGSGTATKGIILKTTTGTTTVNALSLASTGAATFSSTIDCNGTLRFRRIGFSQINTGASQTVTIIDGPGVTAFRSLQVVVTAYEQTNAAIIQLKFDIIARWSGSTLIQSGIGNINRHYCRGFGDFTAYTGLSADIGTSGNAVTLILTNSSAGYINNISCNITENY